MKKWRKNNPEKYNFIMNKLCSSIKNKVKNIKCKALERNYDFLLSEEDVIDLIAIIVVKNHLTTKIILLKKK